MLGLVKTVYLLALTILLVACSESTKSHKYQDLTTLEQPPDIVKSNGKAQDLSAIPDTVKKGLDDKVRLLQKQDKQVLQVDKSFGKTWRLMRKALNHNKIRIVDTNRSKGVFYVLYDADDHLDDNKSGNLLSRVAGLFDNQYSEQDFLLAVESKGDVSLVTAKVVDSHDKLNDDEKADFDTPTDADDKLIEDLYITFRDELPDL